MRSHGAGYLADFKGEGVFVDAVETPYIRRMSPLYLLVASCCVVFVALFSCVEFSRRRAKVQIVSGLVPSPYVGKYLRSVPLPDTSKCRHSSYLSTCGGVVDAVNANNNACKIPQRSRAAMT